MGPLSVQFAVKTKSWYRRFFLAMIGMCETNALMAYRYEVGPIERYSWLCKLADALIHNEWARDDEAGLEVEEEVADITLHQNLHYLNHTVRCDACGRLTHWRCGCTKALCHPGVSEKIQRGPCYFNHIRDCILEAEEEGGGESE